MDLDELMAQAQNHRGESIHSTALFSDITRSNCKNQKDLPGEMGVMEKARGHQF